jgi:hypothetical protein
LFLSRFLEGISTSLIYLNDIKTLSLQQEKLLVICK